MEVGHVYYKDIGDFAELLRSFEIEGRYCRSTEQLPVLISGGVGEPSSEKNVFDGHQALEAAFLIDQGKFLNTMLVKNFLCTFDVRVIGRRYDLLCHDVFGQQTGVCEADVSAGYDTH